MAIRCHLPSACAGTTATGPVAVLPAQALGRWRPAPWPLSLPRAAKKAPLALCYTCCSSGCSRIAAPSPRSELVRVYDLGGQGGPLRAARFREGRGARVFFVRFSFPSGVLGKVRWLEAIPSFSAFVELLQPSLLGPLRQPPAATPRARRVSPRDPSSLFNPLAR